MYVFYFVFPLASYIETAFCKVYARKIQYDLKINIRGTCIMMKNKTNVLLN